MRTNLLIVSVSLLALAMPARAQRLSAFESASAGARHGALAGFGPFTAAPLRTNVAATDAAVNFTVGQSELTVRSRLLLDDMASQLLREPMLRAVIVRPAGPGGAEGALAMQRADVTRAYLGARGVARYRISIAARAPRAATPGGRETAPTSAAGDEVRITIVPDDAAAQSSGDRNG